jgi:gamma-glutamyltranspeptidase/glutathione hydrolase
MQWLPDELEYEPGAFTAATQGALTADGYALRVMPSWGSAQAIVIDPNTGVRYGGSDSRRAAGEALGY